MIKRNIFKETIKKNYILIAIGVILLFICSVYIFRASRKPSYFYVEIKMGQGLWWAQTAKPTLWFIKAIKQGDKADDVFGRTKAEIMEVRYYPLDENQYNIFLIAKIQGKYNKSTKKYLFDNSPIAVGSPIDLEFPNVQVTGTIIDINNQLIQNTYVTKTITFVKKFGYYWEKDALLVGDSYFDGKDTVFTILERDAHETSLLTPDEYGNLTPSTSEQRNYIVLKAKIKVRERFGQFVYGGDQVIKTYSQLNIFTNKLNLSDYIIAGIQ